MKYSSNFEFLEQVNGSLYQLAVAAERNLHGDPHTTLFKVRLFSEEIIRFIAQLVGLDSSKMAFDLIKELGRKGLLDEERQQIFHTLRKLGNKAAHGYYDNQEAAEQALQIAHKAAVIYYRVDTRNANFNPPAFITPLPVTPEQTQSDVDELKAIIEKLKQQKNLNHQAIAEQARKVMMLQGQLAILQSDKTETEQQAKERIAALQAELEEAKSSKEALSESERDKELKQQSDILKASKFDLDEKQTRLIIDQQLRDAGWIADSEIIKYSKGERPEPKKNKAIAEWPIKKAQKGQPDKADYVLFIGLIPVAAVEAKQININVSGAITQAERYSKGFDLFNPELEVELEPAWTISGKSSPWSDPDGTSYQLPFVFSCNGKPYLKQLAERSGTWFRDCRLASNPKRACQSFHTPEGLVDLLKRDYQQSHKELASEPFEYLGLYDFQKEAVLAVEQAITNGQRECLLAMATGTGKTRTTLGMLYRFLKTERFKRILFLVDRTSLGGQAKEKFDEVLLEQNQSLTQIYDVKELVDIAPEAETRVQLATVQAMVKRLFDEQTKNVATINVDQYDCIIVDEAHRGYTLDQEMGEGELVARDPNLFISSYRRVLDYFDAVKIGLTATPAAHTTEIFGKPVFTYSYREAVNADYLIDHEAPIRYKTKLSENGIKYNNGDKIEILDNRTGELDTTTLNDELEFDVESFNRKVINENFDRVVCEALAEDIDPLGKEKTMIFCVTDEHADRVERLLIEAFQNAYGNEVSAKAVQKITGKTDKVDDAIKHYKNERYPNVAITVDLLTTGIDVPEIANLVFMRRVKSRILFEQMLGRATRRCDEIGKTVFRIFDPVDIYASLEKVTNMKPVVKRPNITIEQLISEVVQPENQKVAGQEQGQSFAENSLDELSQKVMRVIRKAQALAETNPNIRKELNSMAEQWGMPAEKIHQHLHKVGVTEAANLLKQHTNLAKRLENVKSMLSSQYKIVISNHDDELKEREQTYGDHQKPEDYLSSFEAYIRDNLNNSAALQAVVNRPKELTREQLKEIRVMLDNAQFKEADLESAWRKTTNREIAASIIGHIRRAAIGEALLPYEKRIDNAMEWIHGLHPWTKPQLRWLERIAKQLKKELILQESDINRTFSSDGGQKGLDDKLGGHLQEIMDTLTDHIWDQPA